METYGRWSYKPLQSPFLNFLRGMETRQPENLRDQRYPFLNFLRGMETLWGLCRPSGPACFLNFLRGMETRLAQALERLVVPLPKLP